MEIEAQFQEHQQLSHLQAQITYNRPYIEDSWHEEAAGLDLMWSCHHPGHPQQREGVQDRGVIDTRGVIPYDNSAL